MAYRKTPHELRENRISQKIEDRPSAYGYEIRSRALSFENDVLHVKLKHGDNERSPTRTFDFSKALLPPNRLHPEVTLLKDRPDLARIIVAVADAYAIRQRITKSTAGTTIALAAN